MKAVKVTAIVIVVIVGALLLILTVGLPAGSLVRTFGDRFAAQVGEKLEVSGGAMLRLLPEPSLVVRGVRLLKRDNPSDPPQLTIQEAHVTVSLASLLRGGLKVTGIELVKPIVRVPQARRADRSVKTLSAPAVNYAIPDIEHFVVKDGSVLLVRPGGRINDRFDNIDIVASLSQPDHRADVKIAAKLGDQPLHIHVDSKAPIETIDQSLPLELTLEVPGLLQGKLSSTLNASVAGSLVKISDLRGAIGEDGFSGTASVELAKKPRVNVNLDFKRLSFATEQAASKPASEPATPATPDRPWSDEPMDFENLNFVDGRVSLTASELDISHLTLAPASLEAALSNGVLNVALSDTGVYGGKVDALLTLNASGSVPRHSMNAKLSGVRARPLLSALADFRNLEGKMRADIDVQGSGRSQRAVISTLAGTIDVDFHDGAIRNVNVANMVRTLTQTTLTGWQKKRAEKTDLNELSALFKIKSGRATTDNLKLLGPLLRVNGVGTADLAAKTLQFKLDTKLVLSLEGQGGAANPIGFGVPVMVEGKWSMPHMYPDVTGILDDPDAAYGKLHDLGAGLFGGGLDLFGDDKGASGTASSGGSKDVPAANGQQAPAANGQQDQAPAVPPAVDNIIKNIFGK